MENYCKNGSETRPIEMKQECFGMSPMTSSIFSSSVSSTASSLSSSPPQNFLLRNASQLYITPLSNTESSSNSPQTSLSTGSPSIIKSTQFCQSSGAVDTFLDSSMSDDQETRVNSNNSNNGHMIIDSGRVNRFFPDGVVDILNKWFYENQNYPYPDENMTNLLAREANISAKQVRKWFANKRVRSNKCYKQTFRVKKESKSASRRQTKSISENDLMFQSNKSMCSENEYDECFADDGLPSDAKSRSSSKRFSFNEYQVKASSPSLSSISSSFASSSPIVHHDSLNNNQQTENDHKFQYRFSPPNTEMLPNEERLKNCTNDSSFSSSSQETNTSSNTMSPAMAAAAALYAPYLMMNLLQNPSVALHAAIAQRLLQINTTNTQDSTNGLNLSLKNEECFKSYPNKRKTHLSNRFMNENSELGYLSSTGSNIKPFTDENQTQQQSTDSTIVQQQLLQYYFQQIQQQQQQQLNNLTKQQTTPTRKTKINFGDISDLIN